MRCSLHARCPGCIGERYVSAMSLHHQGPAACLVLSCRKRFQSAASACAAGGTIRTTPTIASAQNGAKRSQRTAKCAGGFTQGGVGTTCIAVGVDVHALRDAWSRGNDDSSPHVGPSSLKVGPGAWGVDRARRTRPRGRCRGEHAYGELVLGAPSGLGAMRGASRTAGCGS